MFPIGQKLGSFAVSTQILIASLASDYAPNWGLLVSIGIKKIRIRQSVLTLVRLQILAALVFVFNLQEAKAQTNPKTFSYCAQAASPEHVPYNDINATNAIFRCRMAISNDPENSDLWSFIGRSYLKSEQYSNALEWNMKSARAGNFLAQHNLGWMYQAALGVDQSYTEAAKWYRLAAEQGFAASQTGLGWLYGAGQGVKQDYTKALRWHQLAAEQNDAGAQFSLGWMYAHGQGVVQDYSTALDWLQKSADQGNTNALKHIPKIKKDAMLAALSTERPRLHPTGSPSENDVKNALQRKLGGSMGMLDAMGNQCETASETENPISAALCLITLGGSLNSTTMGMQVGQVTLDHCVSMVDSIYLCSYRAKLRGGSGSHPLVGMFTALGDLEGYKYAAFKKDSKGWYVQQIYSSCTFKESGDASCTYQN